MEELIKRYNFDDNDNDNDDDNDDDNNTRKKDDYTKKKR